MLTYDLPKKETINQDNCDPLFEAAVKLIQDTGKASTTFLQRKLVIGYARAAKILDEIESEGLIGPSNGANPRDIFMQHRSNVWETVANKIPKTVEKEPEPQIKWNKTKYAQDKSEDFEINLGLDENNKKVNLNLDKYGNLMIVGSQFTSAVDLLNNILVNSMAIYSPEELRIIAIDGVKGDLIVPNQASHLLTPLIVEPEKSISALKWTVNEIQNRMKGENVWSDSKILILINSYNQIVYYSPSEVEDNLYMIISMGKKYGVYVVVGTDYPNSKTLKLITANCPAKLVFKPTDKKIARDTGIPESADLTSPDEAILETMFEGKKKIIIKKLNPKEIYEEVFR